MKVVSAANLWQRRKMDWCAEKLGIQTQEDWYRVPTRSIRKISNFIAEYHNSSIFSALKTCYPEFEWNADAFHYKPFQLTSHVPKRFWMSAENRRKQLDKVGEKLGIVYQHDWYSVSGMKAKKLGLQSMLTKYHNSSIFDALQSLYPEFEWNPLLLKKVPLCSWKEHKNQRFLMDWIADKLNIVTQLEWYEVSGEQVAKFGAAGLIAKYYNSSLFLALSKIYPEFEWNPLNCSSPPTHFMIKAGHKTVLDSLDETLIQDFRNLSQLFTSDADHGF